MSVKTYVAQEKGKNIADCEYFIRKDTVQTIVESGWVVEVVNSSAAGVDSVEDVVELYSDGKPKAILVDNDVLRIIINKYSSEVFVRVDSESVQFERKQLTRKKCGDCDDERLGKRLTDGLCVGCRAERKDEMMSDKESCNDCGDYFCVEFLTDGLCVECTSQKKKDTIVECERCGDETTQKKIELSSNGVCVECEKEIISAKN